MSVYSFYLFLLQVSQTWFQTHITSKLRLTSRGCRCMHFAVLLRRTVSPGALILYHHGAVIQLKAPVKVRHQRGQQPTSQLAVQLAELVS